MENDYIEEKNFIDFIGKLSDEHKGIPKITRRKISSCEQKTCIKFHYISENVLN